MPKFFIEENQKTDNKIYITGNDVNHIKNVLRLKQDDEIEVCQKNIQINYLCKIEKIENSKIIVCIKKEIETKNESNVKVTIFQGLPKADKMELIIQKAVELGVFQITPIKLNRCIVKLKETDEIKKVERWNKIAEVAAKQCKRDFIPQITNIKTLPEICDIICNYDIVLVAYENEKKITLKEELIKLKKINKENIKIGVIIGPEGGLEEKEVEQFKQNGSRIITLGKRILRTETVALQVLSIIMYELEKQ